MGEGGAARRRLVQDVVALAGIPAPTFDEARRIAWIEQRLADAPGVRRRDRVGNLIWRWGRGRPAVLVMAHVDTVFPAEVQTRVVRRGRRLVGPGVGDNAAAVAVAIAVVERLAGRTELSPGAVAFTVGEEGLGNLRGATEACRALRPTCAIALEGHWLDRTVVDSVGSLRARVAVAGPGGHPWEDDVSTSAVHALLELGAQLVTRSRASHVNVGLISGGRSVNTIADRAELLVEIRSIDESRLETFARRLDRLSVPPPLSLNVDVAGRRPAGRLRRDSCLLRHVKAARAELGLPYGLGSGSSDANAALAQGIPALALGVGRGGGMHTLEEHVDVASLQLGRRLLESVLLRLLGQR